MTLACKTPAPKHKATGSAPLQRATDCGEPDAAAVGLPHFMGGVQTRPAIGGGDDAAARGPEARSASTCAGLTLQRSPRESEIEAVVLPRFLQAQQSGNRLPESAERRHGAALGTDLSHVRVHAGATADGMARALNANAFTAGQDIFFRAGLFSPESDAGSRLLAHELAHTVQQAQGRVRGETGPGGLTVGRADDVLEHEADRFAENATANVGRDTGDARPGLPGPVAAGSTPVVQRQPAPASGAQPKTAAQAAAAAPPAWTDYFDEVVPAILEAIEGSGKVGMDRAMWLIVQAYGEQSPGAAGLPSQHRNRLFNEQAAVIRDPNTQKITGVVPGQEKEGVYLYNLKQNEARERGKTEMKSSPTFGYDTPERAAGHHLEELESRWHPAWKELTAKDSSFETFARGLKSAGYARAGDYDTALVGLQAQVRRQVTSWLKYRLPGMRERAPTMESYIAFLRGERDAWVKLEQEKPDPVGFRQRQIADLNALIASAEKDLEDFRARLSRIERFALTLKLKI